MTERKKLTKTRTATESKFEAELGARVRKLEAIVRGEDRLHVIPARHQNIAQVIESLVFRQAELIAALAKETRGTVAYSTIFRGISEITAERRRISDAMNAALYPVEPPVC
jgi:arginine repressor